MAIEQKELYLIRLNDGKEVNAVCSSFVECIQLYGEENVCYVKKLGKVEVEDEI